MDARPGADPPERRCAMDGGHLLTSNEHESRFRSILFLASHPFAGKPAPTIPLPRWNALPLFTSDAHTLRARAGSIHLMWIRIALCLGLSALSLPSSADVAIAGIRTSLEANVRAHLGLLELGCESPAWLVRWQFREVDADVAAALEALGYYHSKVEKRLTFPKEACWQAEIEIAAGKSVRVEAVNVQIDGTLATEPALIVALADTMAMKGRRLQHGLYETNKRKLMDVALSLGYFDARLRQSEVAVRADAHSAIVTIDIEGGPRYRFGPITFTEGVLDQWLLDAYLPFKEGDFYAADSVARLRRNLADSGYFARAVVTADAEPNEGHTVPVRVELASFERGWTYSLGAGYATDTGPRLRADAENRKLNSKGHRAVVRTLASQVLSTVDAEYRIPHRDPMNDWISFDAGIAREDTDTSQSDVMKVGMRHSYLRWGWIESDFVELASEDYDIADESGQSRLLLFGTTLSRVWRNDPVRPTRGLRLSATVRGAEQSIASDTTFLQIRASSKLVRGLTDSTRVLVRADGGWTWKEEFSDLPPSVRFFAGGDTSIRGYEYQSIGPETDGEVVGGSGLATGSLEFDWTFRPGWSAAAFVDSGSAFDREPEFFTGVGLGLRWYSPLGPLRVDVAHPLDDDKSGLRLHISIGPDL